MRDQCLKPAGKDILHVGADVVIDSYRVGSYAEKENEGTTGGEIMPQETGVSPAFQRDADEVA